MGKILFITGMVIALALIAGAVFFGLTPMGRNIWNQHFNKVTDEITEAQIKSVEVEARALIAKWEEYEKAYDSGDAEAKASMNKAAEEYNQYMSKWGFVFGETLPEGIYAAIEPVE